MEEVCSQRCPRRLGTVEPLRHSSFGPRATKAVHPPNSISRNAPWQYNRWAAACMLGVDSP